MIDIFHISGESYIFGAMAYPAYIKWLGNT